MQRIPVEAASGSYEVIVESGCLSKAREYIAPFAADRRLFLVADENVYGAQGAKLEKGLQGLSFTLLVTELGEQRKRLATVEELATRMHRAGADRKALVLAFGGGVAGDIAGFLAASYMRGVDVIQIPTTLLSQVDSAVGGKTGVNLPTGKNLVGAFLQPRLALIDPAALQTLPLREVRAGLYEVVKYGVIWSKELFELLEAERTKILDREPELLEKIIAESVRIKAAVVAEDEREGGLRRILNYGHTFGHALEAETEYKLLLHGEAVAWGMIAAGRLGEELGSIEKDERERIERLILEHGKLPNLAGLEAERIAERLAGDKKSIGGKVHFVIPEAIGKVRVTNEATLEQATAAIQTALDVVQATAA